MGTLALRAIVRTTLGQIAGGRTKLLSLTLTVPDPRLA